MKKQITITILGMMMLSGAMAMYAGNTIAFETNLTNPVYTVTGNSSNIEGLNITFSNGNINITPALNYKPDNFTLIFFDNITNEVIKEVNVGSRTSGGRRVIYVDKNVTVYVPEYINTTETIEVEVEKILDNTTVLETGYELWHVLFGIGVGIFFGWIMTRKKKASKENTSEVNNG